VLADPGYRRASERIREQMETASGFAGLAKVVDDLSAAPRAKHFERRR
jgi:UDP:flavonoid glycosyltransferase YjiC (YdhE family)